MLVVHGLSATWQYQLYHVYHAGSKIHSPTHDIKAVWLYKQVKLRTPDKEYS